MVVTVAVVAMLLLANLDRGDGGDAVVPPDEAAGGQLHHIEQSSSCAQNAYVECNFCSAMYIFY